MSRSLNKCLLIGNLTRDAEVKVTKAGASVCQIVVATDREWTPKDGDPKSETQFHRVVAWQKLAEIFGQLLKKGDKVYIEGRLQTRRYTNTEGEEKISTEIIANNMILLNSITGRARKTTSEDPITPS